MISITTAVKEVLEMDDLANNALKLGILNYSSYARRIQSKVESITKKTVKVRSIIVALTRTNKGIESLEILSPKISNLSIHTSLQEVTYTKTDENVDKVRQIYKELIDVNNTSSYLAITQSTGEITIVGDSQTVNAIKSQLKIKPVFEVQEIVGVTIRFPMEYLSIPNVIYEFMKKLATKRINIIEVISTTTELTFIIESKDLESTVNQLSKSF